MLSLPKDNAGALPAKTVSQMKYSFIIPVYNRPDEMAELLESLTRQRVKDFEVVVVEDGSQLLSRDVVAGYASRLNIQYLSKANGGPAQARNYGAEHARGDFLLVLDSDVVVPEDYLSAVDRELAARPSDAFGGPGAAHPDFSPLQKAISYSMTSFFTTGGIRGGRKKLDKFYPRSFNMGICSALYRALDGFNAAMRFGEDIDFSIRIFKSGARCRLFPEAWVWHKRRTDFRKFFRQVHNSGIARIHLYKKYPESLKLVHLLPAVFTLGTAGLVLASIVLACCGLWAWAGIVLSPLVVYSLAVCIDSSIQNRSLWIGMLSVAAAFVQLIGYGTGFLWAWWQRCVRGKGEDLQAFRNTFYK